MRYIQRLNKDVNKDNEIYTKDKQRCKQRQWDIYKGKQRQWDNTKAKQRCKQRQWDIYKGKTKM